MKNAVTLGVLVALLMTPTAVVAGGTVQARANLPATVFLDGAIAGTTPLDLTRIAPGEHEVRMVCLATSEVRSYALTVPRRVSIKKELRAMFSPFGPPPAAVQVVEVVAPRPVVVATPPRVVYVTPAPVFGPLVVVKNRRPGRHRHW